jgi:hypothetical protein|tara:strand:- start:201 stop:647 length:447 start_codon:yes stop_codon:yes gene_type:complete
MGKWTNAYQIFNPLFLVFSYVTSGVLFARGMAISSWVLSKANFFAPCNKSTNTLIYSVFCHSLRFYAAMGLFLGALFVHAVGLFTAIFVTTVNQRPPFPLTDRVVIKEESCKFFKSGNLYNNTEDSKKSAMAKVFCGFEKIESEARLN